MYRSGFEKKVMDYLEERGVTYKYESRRVRYLIPESKHYYTPDIELPNGILVEVKGKFDPDARQKMALVLEQNPDLDIRMLFMVDNKISKQSKTRYSDWCTKRGIKFAVSKSGHIPEAWLMEDATTQGEQQHGA